MTQSQLSVVQRVLQTQMRIPESRLLSLSFGEEEIEAQEGSLSLAGPGRVLALIVAGPQLCPSPPACCPHEYDLDGVRTALATEAEAWRPWLRLPPAQGGFRSLSGTRQ